MWSRIVKQSSKHKQTKTVAVRQGKAGEMLAQGVQTVAVRQGKAGEMLA